MATSAMMDLLLRLISCVEPASLRQDVLIVSRYCCVDTYAVWFMHILHALKCMFDALCFQWLDEEKLIQRLTELIHPHINDEVSVTPKTFTLNTCFWDLPTKHSQCRTLKFDSIWHPVCWVFVCLFTEAVKCLSGAVWHHPHESWSGQSPEWAYGPWPSAHYVGAVSVCFFLCVCNSMWVSRFADVCVVLRWCHTGINTDAIT